MRWIRQRRHNDGRHNDDGAVLVFVAISMVMLIGVAALVVDVGAIVQERRTLQNGSDAGALAIAADCGRGNCASGSTPSQKAATYANLNADDSMANVDLVCGVGTGLTGCASPPAGVAGAKGYVAVTTSTRGPNGNVVEAEFSRIFGSTGKTVRRTSVVKWGPVKSATTIPMITSICDFNAIVGSPPNFTSTVQRTVFFKDSSHKPAPCGSVPGGFGWTTETGTCSAVFITGNTIGSDPGNNRPNDCNPATWLGKDVLMPVFTSVTGSGGNAVYTVGGIAEFRVTGYRLTGNNTAGTPAPCSPPDTCLGGYFKRFTTNLGEIGGGDFGVVATQLVG
jgi:Flp pilus assembly protein TadG